MQNTVDEAEEFIYAFSIACERMFFEREPVFIQCLPRNLFFLLET